MAKLRPVLGHLPYKSLVTSDKLGNPFPSKQSQYTSVSFFRSCFCFEVSGSSNIEKLFCGTPICTRAPYSSLARYRGQPQHLREVTIRHIWPDHHMVTPSAANRSNLRTTWFGAKGESSQIFVIRPPSSSSRASGPSIGVFQRNQG